jgi:amino acid transporter
VIGITGIRKVSVIILRKRYPNVHRPFRTPFFPLPQLVGITACIYMIVTIHPEGAMQAQIYAISGGFMATIVAYAVVWLKLKKIPLFTPIPLENLYAQHSATRRATSDIELKTPKVAPT